MDEFHYYADKDRGMAWQIPLLSLSQATFLLMSATPHNGKEEDFQLFMALLDGDRFEGRFRDGVRQVL